MCLMHTYYLRKGSCPHTTDEFLTASVTLQSQPELLKNNTVYSDNDRL